MARRVAIFALVIALGLALRAFGTRWGVPIFIVKYGGSALWGTMVYLLVAIFAARWRPGRVAAAAMTVAIAVEFSRLYHTPSLDAFRLTLAGALLLGRIFSLWNIVAYAVGIGAAFMMEKKETLPRRSRAAPIRSCTVRR